MMMDSGRSVDGETMKTIMGVDGKEEDDDEG